VDLGSGAGNDCFVARHEVGDTGKVIGIDFTLKMIERARDNAEARGFENVEFREGDIEQMPIASNTANVIVSNCVLNLVPNKDGVFKEIFRVLKPGGHFSISDVVLEGALPEGLRRDAEMYAGCVSGAIQKNAYLELIQSNGFENISIQKEKPISIPNDILKSYLTDEEISTFKNGKAGIFSLTVFAQKPLTNRNATCTPGGGCC
jgi:ubiquinone/menaquinone biosynthesis C-methylase UbiE